ncbi:MAG: DUF2284 domain-containing protein [Gammaproteobacteria bacterium]|nr:DUF2284 domain-containing protein [Gammaproteobacteria bacterium]
MRLCNCKYCSTGKEIANKYPLYMQEHDLSSLPLSFDYRVNIMCQLGCSRYRKKPMCPPFIPDYKFYEKVFAEYSKILIVGRQYPYDDGFFDVHWRTYSTNEIHSLLLQVEIEKFQMGHVYAKAFIGGACKLCAANVCDGSKCLRPNKARASLEGTGLDVFSLMNYLDLRFQEPPKQYFWRIGAVIY